MAFKNRNVKGLSLTPAPDAPPPVPGLGVSASPLVAKLNELEVNTEYKLSLKLSELKDLNELGAGNGGTVFKALHQSSGLTVAHKIVPVGGDEQSHRQILRELQCLDDCTHKNIVTFYGAFFDMGTIHICMEYLDLGSLDSVYRRAKKIPEPAAAKIAYEVLQGYNYVYDTHKIIHRDIKPSNILMGSKGEVKLCDFGVSNTLEATIGTRNTAGVGRLPMLKTFVGTSYYMAPERIEGRQYSVTTDSWSLGLSLMEVVLGRFPFPPNEDPSSTVVRQMPVFELINYIVKEEPPSLPAGFSTEFQDFCKRCLDKNPTTRWTPSQLAQHPWIKKAEADNFDLAAWTKTLPAK